MKIFVAGATGAIGRPLISELLREGHTVAGMTRSQASADHLKRLGATVVFGSALDAATVNDAFHQIEPEVVIDELTSLPTNPNEIATAMPKDRELRIQGGLNLLNAAQKYGVRRYLQQSSGFFLRSGPGLANETVGMALDASPRVAASAQTYDELESRLKRQTQFETVALRYGFFYGPRTWYDRGAICAEQALRSEIPILGTGAGVWSWVHIDDAAHATVLALTAPAGIYNIVDDDPSPVSVWLPAFARFVGAPPPPHIPLEQARQLAGEDAVYYQNNLRGASNHKAKEVLGFVPRPLEWLSA